jgi:hypothetical protein
MRIDGGCHCGDITFEADIEFGNVGICHCTDCQTLSGSAFRTVVLTQPGGFKLRSGEPKIYVKTGESGNQRPQAFCSRCGTAIYATSIGAEPKVYSIRVGAIKQRNELVPRRQFWCRSAQTWLGDIDSFDKMERDPAAAAAAATASAIKPER